MPGVNEDKNRHHTRGTNLSAKTARNFNSITLLDSLEYTPTKKSTNKTKHGHSCQLLTQKLYTKFCDQKLYTEKNAPEALLVNVTTVTTPRT